MTTSNPAADEAPWFDKRWTHRVPIWQNHEKISGEEDLFDFPMYFEWTSAALDNAQPSGSDFLFTAGDGVTKLCHEIREWNCESRQLRAYVKVPWLSPNHDTLIFLYFGNPAAVNQEDRAGVWKDYSFIGNLKKHAELNPTLVFETLRKIIQNLMGKEWFSRPEFRIRNHPAYKSDELYLKFISQGGKIRWPEDQSVMKELCSIFMGTMNIVSASGADTDKFDIRSHVLGSFCGFGDEISQSRVKSVLYDPVLYSSLLTELEIAAWCINRKYDITPYEDKGFPDFKVFSSQSKLPSFIECKKLMPNTGNNRIKKVISHANKQIKTAGEAGYGIVILDASELVQNPKQFSDNLPSKVLELEKVVRNTIVSDNSAVSCVIILWNDYDVIGDYSHSNLLSIVFRRRKLAIFHKSPCFNVINDNIFSELGATLEFYVRLSPRTPSIPKPRNSMCDCGSGLKFKQCCGKIA